MLNDGKHRRSSIDREGPYLGEKSHVGMDLCFYCGEALGIVLDKHLRNTLPRAAVYGYEPCGKCKAFMEKGIILISVSDSLTTDEKNPYRTGSWCVVSEEFARKVFQDGDQKGVMDDVFRKRAAFLTDEAWDQLGLPRGDKIQCRK